PCAGRVRIARIGRRGNRGDPPASKHRYPVRGSAAASTHSGHCQNLRGARHLGADAAPVLRRAVGHGRGRLLQPPWAYDPLDLDQCTGNKDRPLSASGNPSARYKMPSSTVRRFTDPDDYMTMARGAIAELTVTGRGDFAAKSARIDLPRLWVARYTDNLR